MVLVAGRAEVLVGDVAAVLAELCHGSIPGAGVTTAGYQWLRAGPLDEVGQVLDDVVSAHLPKDSFAALGALLWAEAVDALLAEDVLAGPDLRWGVEGLEADAALEVLGGVVVGCEGHLLWLFSFSFLV